ncbi:MAG: amidohydrolase family protein [Saccharofermentanales bacterium]
MTKSIIFKNISVISPDDQRVTYAADQFVAISEGKYAYVGVNLSDAVKSLENHEYEVYDGNNRILMPCFVNSHTHLAMTLMRNRADDETLHDWLYNTVFPLEANLRSEDLNSGTLLGIAEMIRSGSGACANMYMVADDAMDSDAAISTGIKLSTVINGGYRDTASGNFIIDNDYFDRVFNKYHLAADGRIRCGVLVHSIYLYDEAYYYGLAEIAKDRNTFVHVHVSETEKEVNDCFAKYQMRPSQILEKMGLFSVPSIAAHCVFLDDGDREILARNNVTVVHNPVSNLKLGSGFADIKKMTDSGIRVAIGTDGPASNNNLDIASDMRFAAYIAKGLNRSATAVNASDIIRMATINGMEGLGFEKSGKVEVGYNADLQIINIDTPEMSPLGDPISAIVYSMNANNVESLMVNGRMLMRNRELLTIDEEKAIYNAKKSSDYLYRQVAKTLTVL